MEIALGIAWRVLGLAGLLAHATNRGVARLLPGRLGRAALRYPVGVVLVVAACIGLEIRAVAMAAQYTTPVQLEVADIGTLGSAERLVTLRGVLASRYVETYNDLNRDHIKEADETGISWQYFLGAEDASTGVVVQSNRPPAEMYATAGPTSITGMFSPGTSDYFAYLPPGLEDLSPSDIPFRLSGSWLYQDQAFAEVSAARDGLIIYGTVCLLLVLGVAVGYVPFRRSPSAAGSNPAPADRPVGGWLTGWITRDGTKMMVRNEEVIVRPDQDRPGGPVIDVLSSASTRPLERISSNQQFDVGEAFGPGGFRYALRLNRKSGNLTLAFGDIVERDAAAAALGVT